MKTRTNIQLLNILLNSLQKGNKENYLNSGLCGEIINLAEYRIISYKESIKLEDTIKSNRPTSINKYKSFYFNPLFENGVWWWDWMKFNPLTREERIKFVQAIIQNLSKKKA